MGSHQNTVGEARVPAVTALGATNYPVLAATVPGSTVGQPLGDGSGRFAVQVAYPTGAKLGSFILGTSKLNEAVWNDVTTDVMSVSWDRGAPTGQRPIAGQLNFQLRNTHRQWSPSQSTYFGPGTFVRVVCGTGTSLTSVQFTGIVQTWNETFSEGIRFVNVTALEPMFVLGGVTNPAVAAVGAGEGLAARVARILDAGQFVFGSEINRGTSVVGTQTFQGTTLDQEILAELSLTVDSIDAVAYGSKLGQIEVLERSAAYFSSSYVLGPGGNVKIRLDQLTTANDDTILLSQVSLARANGTNTLTFTRDGIAGRYRPATTSRSDLITQSDTDLTAVGTGILNRATQTIRPISVTVVAPVAAQYAFLTAVDLFYLVNVKDSTFLTFTAYSVCRLAHRVTPLKSAVYWECDVEFEPTASSSAA